MESFDHIKSQYAILTTTFILLEGGLVAFIALDHRWEKVEPLLIFGADACFFILVPLSMTSIFFQDIPFDPTGELDNIQAFVKENVDVFEWVGISIVIIQARFSPLIIIIVFLTHFLTYIRCIISIWFPTLSKNSNTSVVLALSLLFAIILRSLVSGQRVDGDDIEGDYGSSSSTRDPLINPYSSQASAAIRGDSDIWSSRMRAKVGI
ncbi:hypothetical protein BUALT_Bualt02G0196700 [Buddleja alternifolia]|uniref:Uncharacterized protein n=1 Tax=Buddleja alternifolia TaxID=168488 RepID=A0AAV6YCF1_9LAMI|nr:hypothetical protein BUALT_Bualt02G0196700 [Buddleja alternifolia]